MSAPAGEPLAGVRAIRAIARSLLTNRLDELTDIASLMTQAEEPDYADSVVSHADLDAQMRRTLALALTKLSGDEIPEDLRSAAYETGERRAEQGLPIASLLHSFRIDLRVLWDAIIDEARTGMVNRLELLDQSVLIWEAVESNTAEVVEAYRATEQRIALRTDDLRKSAFERLMKHGETDPSVLETSAGHLSLSMSDHYVVIASEQIETPHEALTRLSARLRSQDRRSYLGIFGHEVLGIVSCDRDGLQRLRDLATETLESKTALIAVSGLREVPRAIRLAQLAYPHQPPGPAVVLNSSWIEVFVALNDDLGEALVTDLLAPLEALPAHESAGLFESLEAFLVSDGTIAGTAAATFRHRNTVRNRLAQIESLIGLDLRRPRDIATLTLAMRRRSIHRRRI